MIPEYFVMDVSGRGVHRIILRAEGGREDTRQVEVRRWHKKKDETNWISKKRGQCSNETPPPKQFARPWQKKKPKINERPQLVGNISSYFLGPIHDRLTYRNTPPIDPECRLIIYISIYIYICIYMWICIYLSIYPSIYLYIFCNV